ncbi:hypothetical protein [Rhodococcoides fascians]|uniref:hypothetical protein n=1 Tax=Rhodococcoides fascians TaxID=1828 RepID=UPI001E4162E5|nr:hypothetical protein [Rhodococcus fascians]
MNGAAANIENSFCAVQVVSPSLCPAQSDYLDATTLAERASTSARCTGSAPAELATAVRSSHHLARMEPRI